MDSIIGSPKQRGTSKINNMLVMISCTAGEFECLAGGCINATWVCDSKEDVLLEVTYLDTLAFLC